jgi:hypothetical protein
MGGMGGMGGWGDGGMGGWGGWGGWGGGRGGGVGGRPLRWDPFGSQGVPSHGIPWAPKGPPLMGSLRLPRVPLPWDPLGSQGVPSHGIPWAPKGSPPMGPLGLARVIPSPPLTSYPTLVGFICMVCSHKVLRQAYISLVCGLCAREGCLKQLRARQLT